MQGWDQGGEAGWFGKEKMGFMGGVLVIGGRRGVVGTYEGMRVTLQVLFRFHRRQEGGCDVRQHPCD
jgi:hypothetical protein